MFELSSTPLNPATLAARLAAPETGALVVFEGRVRNQHLGRPVTRLDYEAFDELARREGEAIVAEAELIYPAAKALCVHRTGALTVGETAVWIGVASPHRAAAFAACRQIIEELKLRLPIWKKEHHPGGAAEWVNCTEEVVTRRADDTYARQTALAEIGATGQEQLAGARVLIAGLGGLGCPAALYLAGAGIGTLTLADSGVVERSNLPRQILFTPAELGAPKSRAAAARLRQHHPTGRIMTWTSEINPGNVRTLVAGHDVLLDCTDNFTTRFLLHDAGLALGVPVVQAAVHGFEGTLDIFRAGTGGCMHCQWLGRAAADLDGAGRCDGGPVFGPAVGVLGTMQAAEAVKLLLGRDTDAARETRLVNLLDGTQMNIRRAARPDCPVCARLDQLQEQPPTAGNDGVDSALFIERPELATLGPSVQLVQLREPGDPAPASEEGVVPAQDLSRLRELAARGPLVLSCRHGLRSAALARLLRAEGLKSVHALAATDSAFARES